MATGKAAVPGTAGQSSEGPELPRGIICISEKECEPCWRAAARGNTGCLLPAACCAEPYSPPGSQAMRGAVPQAQTSRETSLLSVGTPQVSTGHRYHLPLLSLPGTRVATRARALPHSSSSAPAAWASQSLLVPAAPPGWHFPAVPLLPPHVPTPVPALCTWAQPPPHRFRASPGLCRIPASSRLLPLPLPLPLPGILASLPQCPCPCRG